MSEVSRRAGVFDYAGLAGNLALSFPVHAAFRHLKSVGTLIGCFRSSIALPTYSWDRTRARELDATFPEAPL